MDNSIGLHIYAITLHQKGKPKKKIPLMASGEGSLLSAFCPHFVKHHTSPIDPTSGFARAWYLAPEPSNGQTFEGWVMYGSTGFAADIVDRKSRAKQYSRKVTDMEVIPLYYRLWVPHGGDFALLGLQTFGQRSCVNRFRGALEATFRSTNAGYRIVFNPVAPAQIAAYKKADVKKLSLIKHNYSSDAAENQLGSKDELVDLNVSFTAKPRSHLGNLASFANRITSGQQAEVLNYADTDFDEATAEVMIGGKRRKVVLIGMSQNTGKFDLTDAVQRTNGIPTLASISLEVKQMFADIV